MSESLIFAHFLFFCEQCEWIAHFAQIKWAMWANRSFRSPKMSDHERFAQVAQRKWAMWANRSFCSPKMSKWVNRSLAHFLTKTSDLFGNQMSEFPALLAGNQHWLGTMLLSLFPPKHGCKVHWMVNMGHPEFHSNSLIVQIIVCISSR